MTSECKYHENIMKKEKRVLILQPLHVKAFRFIERYTEKNKYAPKLTDIADYLKPITLRQTYRIVDELCEMQYLSRTPYRLRSLKVERSLEA